MGAAVPHQVRVALGLVLLLLCAAPALAEPVRFERLLVDLAERPFNVDRAAPSFSWVAASDARAQGQSAYRIRVASSEALLRSGAPDLWAPDWVTSAETLHRPYAGKPLESDTTYYWSVAIRDLEKREVEVIHGRSHGWIDVLAFDPRTGTLLVIEVKTRIDDLGSIERQLGWYERAARDLARGLGWRPRHIAGWLVGLARAEVDAAIRANGEALRRRSRCGPTR